LLLVVTEDWYFLSHRLGLARAARSAGLRVVVATGPGERGSEIRAAGLEHRVFALERGGIASRRELRALFELGRLMRSLRPDIVHLVAAKPIMYGNIAAALTGRPPVVSAVAGLGYLYLGEGTGRRLLRAAYERTFRILVKPRRSARVLVQNADDAALLLQRGMARADQLLTVVGAGVDVERFAFRPEPEQGPIVILCHTRMLWDKGLGELVEACRLLRERAAHDFVLRLVGDPDPKNPAAIPRETLEGWARTEQVEWLGRRADIPLQLERAHIACLPSYREGAPLSLLEAAAAGRAIVTTDVPGCREVVRHEDNGLLVAARDAQSLAAALGRLIGNADERRRMGRRGRERAELEFAAGVVNTRIIETYRAMLQRDGAT
jgi:glycosyltransferase involved in cell wall biosynthesis